MKFLFQGKKKKKKNEFKKLYSWTWWGKKGFTWERSSEWIKII
jgi:hypothetical protein